MTRIVHEFGSIGALIFPDGVSVIVTSLLIGAGVVPSIPQLILPSLPKYPPLLIYNLLTSTGFNDETPGPTGVVPVSTLITTV